MVIKIEVFPCNPWALLETYRGEMFRLDRGYSRTACVVRLYTGEARFKLRSYDSPLHIFEKGYAADVSREQRLLRSSEQVNFVLGNLRVRFSHVIID
jgi:hypothetical protein